MMQWMEVIVALLGLIGLALVTAGNQRGFMVWLASSCVAVPYFAAQHQVGLALLYLLYGLFNIKALLRPAPAYPGLK